MPLSAAPIIRTLLVSPCRLSADRSGSGAWGSTGSSGDAGSSRLSTRRKSLIAGDKLVERKFGEAGVGGALGIVIGSVVDGVPESLIFGIGVAAGVPVSLGFLGAVIVSNVPQALAPSVDLYKAGWSRARLGML